MMQDMAEQYARQTQAKPLTVMVSGCFDVVHGGHVQFLRDAKALGHRLVVCAASDRSIQLAKGRRPAMPLDDRIAVLRSIDCVDEVYVGDLDTAALNFENVMHQVKPDILAVTDDDQYEGIKRLVCCEMGCRYVKLPKRPVTGESSTSIRKRISTPSKVPLRVDFAGGWLDVPRFARSDGYIINCTITPMVSLSDWPYHKGGGLGGSAAWSILNGNDPFKTEGEMGVGWQDPAVITETGLCVWQSGPRPKLIAKYDPSFLDGLMALYWTGTPHNTAYLSHEIRDYGEIARISKWSDCKFETIFCNILNSYNLQLDEGMQPLPSKGELSKKYCGSGHGGYAVYLYETPYDRDMAAQQYSMIPIEPYIREYS